MEDFCPNNSDTNNLNKISNSNNINENKIGKNYTIDFLPKKDDKLLKDNNNIQNINTIDGQFNNQNTINFANNSNINRNSINKYQEEIENFYDEIFKEDTREIFIKPIIDNKNNNLDYLLNKAFKIIEKIKLGYIEQICKEKIITIICLLNLFSKEFKKLINDNIFKSSSEIDKNLFLFLQKSILTPDISEIFDFSKKNIKKFSKEFCKNLYLENSQEGKNLIFTAYSFLIILRAIKDYPDNKVKQYFGGLLKEEYLISFKIHFILKNKEFYNAISEDFNEIYHGFNFISIFYNEILNEITNDIRIIKDDKIGKYIFGKNKFILSFDNIYKYNIDILFTKEDNAIYRNVMDKICHFYSINQYNSNDINDLIYNSSNKIGNKESNFILNIVELIFKKSIFINNNFVQYQNNLKKLESQIFDLGKKTLNINKRNKTIYQYSINEEQKFIFLSLLNKINQNIYQKYKGKFHLYPIGSMTEFLCINNSDIDLYLDIEQIISKYEKIEFLYHLRDIIGKIIKEMPNLYISTRLCVMSFKYKFDHGQQTDFDITLTGFCSYLHSILFRTYSLIDARFSLLAITLKKFIECLDINNKKYYLNSFSWMVLLTTFLQDIIKPPILPKILSNKYNYIIRRKISYATNSNRKHYYKSFETFMDNLKEENILLPDSLFDKKSLFERYNEQIRKNRQNIEKNNLSCAEIFLYFLEFIIFYFKNDSVYANCSIENEGYESMYSILGINNNINKTDKIFSEYFKNKYFKYKNYNNNKIERDGLILVRDPIDSHYNPAHTLISENFNYFIENLKNGYFYLLRHGDLYDLNS